MPRVGGRKQPLHGNVQARPFDYPPRRLTLNTMHMMSQFCYNRSFDVLRKTTDRMITADTNNFAITQEKVRVTCFECGAGYRRIELAFRPGTRRRVSLLGARQFAQDLRWLSPSCSPPNSAAGKTSVNFWWRAGLRPLRDRQARSRQSPRRGRRCLRVSE